MHQKAEYDNATHSYLFRQEFQKNELKGPKVCDDDHITNEFLWVAHRQSNLERQVNFQILVLFQNFRVNDSNLMVHEFITRPNRSIIVIG